MREDNRVMLIALSRAAASGNTGVSLASGLGWYLKYYVNASWSWGRSGSGNQMAMPSMLPMPPALERHVNPNKSVH